VADVEGVSVSDVIGQLRGELYRAGWLGEGKEPRFRLGPIELEFAVVVDSSHGASASAKLWVVDVGVDGKRSSQRTHRIKLTLFLTDLEGAATSISGVADDGEERS
jgi:hypothetical protein